MKTPNSAKSKKENIKEVSQNLKIFFALYKNYCYLCRNKNTDAMTDKKMKRYKIWVWVWLILTATAYINAVIDIINVIRKLWE